jgi:hypothetical protein
VTSLVVATAELALVNRRTVMVRPEWTIVAAPRIG